LTRPEGPGYKPAASLAGDYLLPDGLRFPARHDFTVKCALQLLEPGPACQVFPFHRVGF
jgi:hypothetical protein